MWNYEISISLKDKNGKKYLYTYSPIYQITICRLFSKIGDILTANRRFNWIGMRLYENNIRGIYFYTKIKDFILTGKIFKTVTSNNTDKKKYVI